MNKKRNDKLLYVLIGLLAAFVFAGIGGIIGYKNRSRVKNAYENSPLAKVVSSVQDVGRWSRMHRETFDKPVSVEDGAAFGEKGFLTFELYRDGTFSIDPRQGAAVQTSPSYRDVSLIRSTQPLPEEYRITAVVGGIDYGLEMVAGLEKDTQYAEGPKDENGVYLLAVTDEEPSGHHTNDWWHQHRKVVIDVDNNVWGHGMPNPIFMVYFTSWNEIRSFDGDENVWTQEWKKGISYDPDRFYRVTIEKSRGMYTLTVATEEGVVLKQASVELSKVWHTDKYYDEHFVLGDPHENYYTGNMVIKEIVLEMPNGALMTND